MFNKLREILLTQYIGSILIALLVLQAASEVVIRAVQTGVWFFNLQHSESVFGGSTRAPFPWDRLIFSAVTTALYLLTAYTLARWLFPDTMRVLQTDPDPTPSTDPPENS